MLAHTQLRKSREGGCFSVGNARWSYTVMSAFALAEDSVPYAFRLDGKSLAGPDGEGGSASFKPQRRARDVVVPVWMSVIEAPPPVSSGFAWRDIEGRARREYLLVVFTDEGDLPMQRSALPDLNTFLLVAEHLNFRAAAERLALTAPAVSHSIRQLEARLGARLLNRTTRSVALTHAGVRLLERLRPAFDQISGALEELNEERQRPTGALTDLGSPIGRDARGHADLAALLVDLSGRATRNLD